MKRDTDEEDERQDQEEQNQELIGLIFFIPGFILFIRVPLVELSLS
jgi:hypothetical protein